MWSIGPIFFEPVRLAFPLTHKVSAEKLDDDNGKAPSFRGENGRMEPEPHSAGAVRDVLADVFYRLTGRPSPYRWLKGGV